KTLDHQLNKIIPDSCHAIAKLILVKSIQYLLLRLHFSGRWRGPVFRNFHYSGKYLVSLGIKSGLANASVMKPSIHSHCNAVLPDSSGKAICKGKMPLFI